MVRDLFAGRIPLRHLVRRCAIPTFVVVWLAGGCAIAGCPPLVPGAGEIPILVLLLGACYFTLFMAIPIWRSALKYTGDHRIVVWTLVYVLVSGVIAFVFVFGSIAALVGWVAHLSTAA